MIPCSDTTLLTSAEAGVTGAILGQWGSGASGCRFGFLGFAASRAGRFRFGPTMN